MDPGPGWMGMTMGQLPILSGGPLLEGKFDLNFQNTATSFPTKTGRRGLNETQGSFLIFRGLGPHGQGMN